MEEINFDKGAFLFSRSVFDSLIWQMPTAYFKIFFYLVGQANHQSRKYKGYYIERGQHFCTYKDLLEQISYNRGYAKERPDESLVKHIMRWFKKEGMITTVKKPRGVLITVVNYTKYQSLLNYKRTNEITDEGSIKEPSVPQSVPSINNNEKNENNFINSTHSELEKNIIKYLKTQEDIKHPHGYLLKLKKGARIEAIKKAWNDWKHGSGITSTGGFFERAMYYEKQFQKAENHPSKDVN